MNNENGDEGENGDERPRWSGEPERTRWAGLFALFAADQRRIELDRPVCPHYSVLNGIYPIGILYSSINLGT